MANDTSRPAVDAVSNGGGVSSPRSGSEAQPEGVDASGNGIAGQQMSSVWKRPSNGVFEPASVIGGASSWPALGETARPVPRSSDNARPASDGSASSLQAPIISQPPPRLPNNTNNTHGNSTAHNPLTRQKSRNRNGGGGGSGGGGNSSASAGPSQNNFNHPSPPVLPSLPAFEVPYGMVPAVMDNTSVRVPRPVSVGSQSHASNEHYSPRNNNNPRRGNYGPHRPRGDRLYHNNNNHGSRRDQDRRDVHHHPPPQFVPPPMGYMAPPLPPGAVPFMAPQPMRIFPGGFDMASPYIYVPGLPPPMPLVPSPPPMLFPPANEKSLTNMIVKQIDFYFSDDNLVKDNYLRSNMDDHGWVPIGLIASFRRVQLLTKDISVILESLRYSEVVEVEGDKLRRRDGWNKWLPVSARRNHESALASSLKEVSLDNADCNVNAIPETAEGRFSAEENLPNGE